MYPDPELGPAPPQPTPPTQSTPSPGRPPLVDRAVAALEVLICSDYPTQVALGATFAALGYRPLGADGHLLIGYVVAVSLLDTALLLGLIFFFLHAHGERPRDVILGSRPVLHEAARGIPLIFIAIGMATGVLYVVQRVAPSLHTEHNPFQELIRTPGDAAIFAFILIVAGGIREEIQRAFLLHRFEVWLGGGAVGIVITSAAFGAGHFQVQGADAAIATALLGVLWGVVYLRRRSAVAPIVSHSGFDVLQVVQYFIIGS